ncbi:MAG: hypothetical protein PWQ55_1951 [Chloroflexota bacterium]|nr:hypothetical protein [Chloroflexota bacterium]
MVLVVAVLAGALFGIVRAKMHKMPYQAVQIQHLWLVLAAYVPQFFIFFFPATRSSISDRWVAILFVLSQVLLLAFIWINRRIPGGWLMGIGLLLNFLAISLNGGMMPLTPENAQHLLPAGSNLTLTLGERVGTSKDILLEKSATRLWFLGDVFLLPKWFNFPMAFSPGDVLLSLGAFWLFWELGNPKYQTKEVPA